MLGIIHIPTHTYSCMYILMHTYMSVSIPVYIPIGSGHLTHSVHKEIRLQHYK